MREWIVDDVVETVEEGKRKQEVKRRMSMKEGRGTTQQERRAISRWSLAVIALSIGGIAASFQFIAISF